MGDIGLWIFLAATVVASLSFVSVVVWVGARRLERQEFYKNDLRKRLVEAGKMDAESLASLIRYEHDLGLRHSREKLLVASFIFLGMGVGTCFGLSFIDAAVWKLGFVPVGMGLCMMLYGFVFAAKPNVDTPPLGASSELGKRD